MPIGRASGCSQTNAWHGVRSTRHARCPRGRGSSFAITPRQRPSVTACSSACFASRGRGGMFCSSGANISWAPTGCMVRFGTVFVGASIPFRWASITHERSRSPAGWGQGSSSYRRFSPPEATSARRRWGRRALLDYPPVFAVSVSHWAEWTPRGFACCAATARRAGERSIRLVRNKMGQQDRRAGAIRT